MNRIFIGDVHGCIETLKALIEKINPSKEDTVRFVGDLIDRGPNSKAVLDFIINKQLEGYDWLSIMGNHESMLLEVCDYDQSKDTQELGWWIDNGGYNTIQSFSGEIPDFYISWIKNLPLYLIAEDIILVHGGLAFIYTDPIKRIIEDSNLGFLKCNHLWMSNNNIDESKLCGKILIVGHTITPINQIINHEKYYIRLDNGCFTALNNYKSQVGCGCLVAYNLDKDEFITQICIERNIK
jgi:serine/threonine protein phosphatase 1